MTATPIKFGPKYKKQEKHLFLPNFCNISTILTVVVMAELLAFTLALIRPTNFLEELSLISLFIQWVALVSAAVLCLLRPLLWRLKKDSQVALVSFFLFQCVTLSVSEVCYWLIHWYGDNWLLPTDHYQFLLQNLGISIIVSGVILRYFFVQHQWRVQVQAEAEAHFQSLQSRIRPHFLFNSMNTIASLTTTNPQVAEEVVEDLADLFRVSLSDAKNQSSLHDELLFTHQYLQIERHRLGERLNIEWQMDGVPEDAVLPPLTLQPLLENAVYHGVEPSPEGEKIIVKGYHHGNTIHIAIYNGIPPDGVSKRKGNHLAMDNIKARLSSFYSGQSEFKAGRMNENQFEVAISFPYWKEQVTHDENSNY